jgi:hypothetical protein
LRFERQCAALNIEHELISLQPGEPKQWRPHGDLLPHCAVESAALRHYEREGWQGCASEGGLILTLLKAASFPELSPRHANTFIEALYAQNVAFAQDRFDAAQLIGSVERASLDQIRRNWRTITATAGDRPAYYDNVRWPHVEGLYRLLGNARLAEIARIFATAPYDLRAGWPDLALWRNGEVRFVEVKAPGDRLHASQTRLIRTILLPLHFRTGLAEVVPTAP